METILTSRHNPHLKLLRGVLAERKIRAREGLFAIEGARLLMEAIEAGLPLVGLFLRDPPADPQASDRLRQAGAALKLPVYRVAADVFDGCVSVTATVDAAALAAKWQLDPGRLGLASVQRPALIILENVSDPGNLGAALRVADAAGMTALMLLGRAADPFGPKVVRASAGSLFHVPIARGEGISHLTSMVPGLSAVGFGVGGGIDYTELDWTGPTALVFGSEASGLTADTIGQCHRMATIPMPGRAHSLNLATAIAVAAFELVRQRRPSREEREEIGER